jgi:acetyltransferase-like isoleucine patch superfamily enzyme
MINLLATLRFNIKAFGLSRGLKLPVFIYGRIKMPHIGTIRINCPLRRGLVVIGVNHDTVVAPYTMFCNTGTVHVNGRVYFNYGTTFLNRGVVTFAGDDLIGKQCYFDIYQRLDIGYNVSIGYECHIADSDNHFVADVNTHKVHRNSSPIKIGNFNWFGSNCFIKKGTVTPDYLVLASPFSMLCKDYTSLPAHTVMAGCPARPVKQGIRRIYNFKVEAAVRDYFQSHPESEFYQIDHHADLDAVCRL